MRYKQVEDILDWVGHFHSGLEARYRQLEANASKERVALLLDYLADHEQHSATAIRKYKGDASSGLLRTWFNHIPDVHYPEKLVVLLRGFSDASTTEVVAVSIECHDLLIGMYKSLRIFSDTLSTEELFQSLLEMEEHEKIRMVRDAAGLEDF